MLCCPECFGDRGLRDVIFPALGSARGNCDFCKTKKVKVIPPRDLAPYFELIVNVYEADDEGMSLAEWIKTDWRLFSGSGMSAAKVNELLVEILGNAHIVDRPVSPSRESESHSLIGWGKLRDEIMHANRWFWESPIDTDRLEALLVHLMTDDLPGIWHRARLSADGLPYPIEEMGAPPKRLVSHGRANPVGIPYLYLSSDPETAISEIRPYTGETVCVADFKAAGLRVVDLRNPRGFVSPFLLEDADSVAQLRIDIPFLERLGVELARPIKLSSAAIDYIPTQYLCEFIKKCGYDGVVYRSSVSDGINLALFDPTKANGGGVETYKVNRVQVDAKKTRPLGGGRAKR